MRIRSTRYLLLLGVFVVLLSGCSFFGSSEKVPEPSLEEPVTILMENFEIDESVPPVWRSGGSGGSGAGTYTVVTDPNNPGNKVFAITKTGEKGYSVMRDFDP